jgi:hypothetical protein
LLLGTARRIFSSDDDDAAPLMPIRSFRFFLPIIDELKYAHLDQGYVNYLARKLSDSFGKQLTLKLTDEPAQLPQRNRRTPRQLLLPW